MPHPICQTSGRSDNWFGGHFRKLISVVSASSPSTGEGLSKGLADTSYMYIAGVEAVAVLIAGAEAVVVIFIIVVVVERVGVRG